MEKSLDNFKEIVGKFVTRLGDPSRYEFRGEVIDLGQYGNGKCTCDHPIRYMFLIWGPNGKVAPVGRECINKLENACLGLAREKAEATRQVKKAETQPTFELAKERFLAICEMHKKRINFMIPRAMWLLYPRRKQSLLAKSIPSLSYRKMADIVSLLRQEVKSRNPLFVNAYVPCLDNAEAVLREIHYCERYIHKAGIH